MTTEQSEFVPGPRCGDVDGAPSSSCGQYQFPALDTTGAVIDLTVMGWQFVRATWIPDDTSHYLLVGFFATEALADAGFDVTTASSDSDPAVVVLTAPDFIPSGVIDLGVPATHRWMRVEASAGAGRCMVRNSDSVFRG